VFWQNWTEKIKLAVQPNFHLFWKTQKLHSKTAGLGKTFNQKEL